MTATEDGDAVAIPGAAQARRDGATLARLQQPGPIGATLLEFLGAASLAGRDWPLALCTGGYERGPVGLTIAGRQPVTGNHGAGAALDACADWRPELTAMSRAITAMEERFQCQVNSASMCTSATISRYLVTRQ
jgi:hypothetical protein